MCMLSRQHIRSCQQHSSTKLTARAWVRTRTHVSLPPEQSSRHAGTKCTQRTSQRSVASGTGDRARCEAAAAPACCPSSARHALPVLPAASCAALGGGCPAAWLVSSGPLLCKLRLAATCSVGGCASHRFSRLGCKPLGPGVQRTSHTARVPSKLPVTRYSTSFCRARPP